MSRLAFPSGPTGLGTAASRLPASRPSESGVSIPPLYGPRPVRINEPLGAEVDERLVAWFLELGIFTDKLDHLREASFGRQAMLAHPDTDDPDRLMLAARWACALWATDDVYTDDETMGRDPRLAGGRLALALAALRPPPLHGDLASQLAEALRSDPVLIALGSSVEWLERNATSAQVARARQDAVNSFLMWTAKASWRMADHRPPVWEYLAIRQIDNFQPCMALIDVVGGYEVPDVVFSDPRVQRAYALAGSVAVLTNDIYSMAREGRQGDYNLPQLIAVERNCSLQEAVDISVAYRTDLVHALEDVHRGLVAYPSPELQRFLLGLWAWIGGCDEWHRTSERYHSGGES